MTSTAITVNPVDLASVRVAYFNRARTLSRSAKVLSRQSSSRTLRGGTELQMRLPPGCFFAHAPGAVVGDLLREMQFYLLCELGVAATAH